MKKSSINCILACLLLVCVIMLVSCGEANAKNDVSSHKCEFSEQVVYKERNNKLYIGYPCKHCETVDTVTDVVEVDYVIEPTNRNPDELLAKVKSGSVLVYKSGRHTSAISRPLNGATLYGETGSSLYAWNGENLLDVTVCNLNFEGGVTLKGGIDGLTYKNCNFSCGVASNSLIKRLTFESCEFVNITYEKETAIRLLNYETFTVKNCLFENVAYNALQVGGNCARGNVLISGNTFKNIKSRILYFVDVSELISCTVVDNIFYDHHHNYVEDEVMDISGCKKENGVYIYTKSTFGILTVGVNTWENIPWDDEKYIAPLAVYGYDEQLALSVE